MRKTAIAALLLFFAAGCAEKETTDITIFFTGDSAGVFWSRQEPEYGNREVGGLAVLKNMLSKERHSYILADTGNWFAGTPEGTLDNGEKAVALMNMTGYHVSAAGSEDMDIGLNAAAENFKKASFPVIASNISPANRTKKHFVTEINGVKIGFMSLMPREVVFNSARSTGIKVSDELSAGAAQVKELRNKGADIVVLLLNTDIEDTKNNEEILTEEIDGIDLVLMSSSFSYPKDKQYGGGGIFTARTGRFLEAAGKVKINVDENKKINRIVFENILLSKDKFGEDPEIKKAAAETRRMANVKLKNILTKAEEDINISFDAPSPLGALAAECLQGWAKTDFALINADSLRKPIFKGPVAEYVLYDIYPYNDSVMSVRIRGEEIKDLLEKSLTNPGSFPQTHGLEVFYNPAAPQGSRIKDIKINGSKIRKEYIYKLATTDHMIASAFGAEQLPNMVEFKNTQVDMRTVLRLCLRKKKSVSPKTPSSWKIQN